MDCEKRLKFECIDRISDLPDSILGEILSHMPLKEVIATSILSTRWKALFPSCVPLFTRLVFDDTHFPRRNNFVDFVDKLLNMSLRDVEKVVLDCKKIYDDANIISWIRSALRHCVKHLRLMSYLGNSMPLFRSLNGCTTLVELEFGDLIDLKLPGEEFSLPNLKRLMLKKVILQRDVDFRKLIGGCPVLNELSIMSCHLWIFDVLHIQHPFITKLIMEDCFTGTGNIVIDAANLETLVHKGQRVSNYVCENVTSLRSVSIDFVSPEHKLVFRSKALPLAELVKACSRTTQLSLSGDSLMALYCSGAAIPLFRHLTCLVLGHMGTYAWRMLARILKSAPNIAKLTFEEELEFTGASTNLESLFRRVPICLKLHIKKIEIWKFKWTPDEIKLIEYFLKYGRMLEELRVHCLPHANTSQRETSSIRRMLRWLDTALIMGGDFTLKGGMVADQE